MKLLTGTQVVIGIVGMIPIDFQLIVVPVHVRNVAINIERTRLLPDLIHFTENLLQNFLSLPDRFRNFFMKHFVFTKTFTKAEQAVSLTTWQIAIQFFKNQTDYISLFHYTQNF